MVALGVYTCESQNGKDRYPDKDDAPTPKVALYRNNLTALSQYHNLLFVASLDKIHVFRPFLPNQHIPSRPELVIDVPSSRYGLDGYLDSSHPHGINHLVVGNLGNEEVVAIACDDGDIISYLVRSIELVVEHKQASDSPPFSLPTVGRMTRPRPRVDFLQASGDTPHLLPTRCVEPWFIVNVGMSAWGLAIHEDARLIAASSNTKRVDVFAPALGNGPPSDIDFDNPRGNTRPTFATAYIGYNPASSENWKPVLKLSSLDRSSNQHLSLQGHSDNIPNISFCNTDLDREGRYLASTDINGSTIIWDILKACTIFKVNNGGNLFQNSRGWDVACLDPRAAILTQDPVETFGCKGHVDNRGTGRVVDVSEGNRSIADNSHWHPAFANWGAIPGVNLLNVLAGGGGFTQVADANATIEATESDDDEVDWEPDPDNGADLDSFMLNFDMESEPANVDEQQQTSPTGVFAQASDPTNANEEQPTSYHEAFIGQLSSGTTATAADSTPKIASLAADASPNQALPFDVLQTSARDINLFHDILIAPFDLHKVVPFTRVESKEALHQQLPPGLNHMSPIERLNMVAQIPELGVVVIGNQIGRVGVLTITRCEKSKQAGYRIKCILPFQSQEEKGLRPQKLLMGLAVGPIQGHLSKPERGSLSDDDSSGRMRHPRPGLFPRRFRLMIFYCDHTVLSYDLYRQSGDYLSVS